jgi:hypothetical protein
MEKSSKKRVKKVKESLWKNNINFLKDVPIIYVNVIRIVIMSSNYETWGINFVPPPAFH